MTTPEAAPTEAEVHASAILSGAAHPTDFSVHQTDRIRELVLHSHFAWMVLVMGAQDFMHYPVHGPMCAFIDKWGQPGWERLMVQVTRDIGKTTVCTRGNALRQVALAPDEPIAIFNERIENTAKWLRVMRETVMSSAVFKTLFPHLLPPGVREGGTPPRGWKWNDHELQFQRGRSDIPEVSITGLGIGAASTGGHWSKIIKDDIITKDAQDSPLVMSWAKDWFDKSFYLERPALLGWDLVVCTPWTHDDVYTHALKNYNYRLYRRAGMEDGASIWEEKMPTRILLQHQARDPAGFSAQVMCQPTAGVEASFRKEWLHDAHTVWDGNEPYVYHSDERYDPRKSEIEEKAPRKVALSEIEKVILLDPAPTEDSERKRNPGARNAIVVVGCDTWGRKYVLDAWAARVDPEQVIDKLLSLARRWGTTRIGIEEVVFSFLYRHWLRRIAKDRGIEVSPTALTTKGREKGARIQALINPCKAGWWHVDPSLGNFMQEYVEYPYSSTVDLLDAWAYSQDILHRPVSTAERLSTYWADRRMDRTRDKYTGY